jgi:hypothetical protein
MIVIFCEDIQQLEKEIKSYYGLKGLFSYLQMIMAFIK